MSKKFTDEEVVKAALYCAAESCETCPLRHESCAKIFAAYIDDTSKQARQALKQLTKLAGEQITGCSWSMDRQPVVGWKTNQHRMYESQKGGMIHSYTVTECPEFEED